jgi:transposase InsO family protein
VTTEVALRTAAVAGLVTVAFLLLRGVHGVSTPGFLQVGFGVVSVVASWALVHPLFNDQRADALAPWIEHYNNRRRHSALGGLPPISRLAPT